MRISDWSSDVCSSDPCYLGLPTITVTCADNQVRTTEDVAVLGIIKYLGRCDSFAPADYEKAIRDMLDAPGTLLEMTVISLDLVQYGTGRIADAMQGISDKSSWCART